MKLELGYINNLKQEQTQKQKLTMTPKLQEAIKLLQFSTLELKEYLKEEMMDNPLLELDANSARGNYVKYGGEEIDYENFVAKDTTLEEYLLKQLNLLISDRLEKKIAKQIIGNLNHYGFFTDINSVSQELEVTKKEVKAVLAKIKKLRPAGVGASGVKESLIIQLDDLKEDDNARKIELCQQIVNNYWEELDKNQIRKIATGLKVKPVRAQKLIDLIKSLNQNPIKKFQRQETNNYLEADIIIKKNKDKYVIIMEESSFPTLYINEYYRKLLKKNASEENRSYLKEKLDSALWLKKSIEQRRQTIYRIVEEIIDWQKDFLDKGIDFLKPMTMQKIADRIEMHQSTVSRAVNNKNLQTPQGLFPMKFLFSEGIKTNKQNLSVVSIKNRLQDLIAAENKKNPLSDRQLKERLKEEGIDISRRTVASYRKELKIPSSRQRKRYE